MKKIINNLKYNTDSFKDCRLSEATELNLSIILPVEGSIYRHGDKIMIGYEADDYLSGIVETKIKIDNKLISNGKINLFNYKAGAHTLLITVYNKAGSQIDKKVNFKITVDVKSIIADINEAYKNGCLKGFFLKNSLISKLKYSSKLKKSKKRFNVFEKKLNQAKQVNRLDSCWYKIIKNSLEYFKDE